MGNGKVRAAAVIIADKVRRGEIAVSDDVLVGGDIEGWAEGIIGDKLARDDKRLRALIRDAQRGGGAQHQLTLPGLEHAALPACVLLPNGRGSTVIVPAKVATFAQIKAEVRAMEKLQATVGRVIGGYRATLDELDRLGVPDSATGAEIFEAYRAQR